MTRRARLPFVVLAIAASAGIGACTAFNDLHTVPNESAVDGSLPPHDGGAGDASKILGDGSVGSPLLGIDDAVHLCAKVLACPELAESLRATLGFPVQNENFSACADLFAGPRPVANAATPTQAKALQAVLATATCTAALGATAFESLPANSTLCVDAGTRCEPSTTSTTTDVISCDEGLIYHCGTVGFKPGSSCYVSPSKDVFDCVTPGNCATSPNCDGNYILGCDEDDEVPDAGNPNLDCSLTGATCNNTDDQCDYGSMNASSCSLSAPLTACSDSETVTVCTFNAISVYKCSDLGEVCNHDTPYDYCAFPNAACTPFDKGINTCDSTGQILSLCVGGENVSYDCTKLGLKCAVDSSGLSASCQ